MLNNKFLFNEIKQNNNLYKLMKYLEKYNNNQSTYYYTKILFYNNKMNFKGGAITPPDTKFAVLSYVLNDIMRYNSSYYYANNKSSDFKLCNDLHILLQTDATFPQYIYCNGALIEISRDNDNILYKYGIYYNEDAKLNISCCTINSFDDLSITLQYKDPSMVIDDKSPKFYLYCTLYEGISLIDAFFIKVYTELNNLYYYRYGKYIKYDINPIINSSQISFIVNICYISRQCLSDSMGHIQLEDISKTVFNESIIIIKNDDEWKEVHPNILSETSLVIKNIIECANATCQRIQKNFFDTFSIINIKKIKKFFEKTIQSCGAIVQSEQIQKEHKNFKMYKDAIAKYNVNTDIDSYVDSSVDSLISFLNNLLQYKIRYFFVERALNYDPTKITKPYFCRYWYFQKFNIDDNLDVLKECGCNCTDLINLCRIKFNKFPPYYTCDDIILKNIMTPNINKQDEVFNYGSYPSWYYHFKLNIDNKYTILKYTDIQLTPGTLLLAPYDSRQHVAIIYSNDNKGNIKIIHSYPEDSINYEDEYGMCDPGICIDDLKNLLYKWQVYFMDNSMFFNFELAIPLNDWLHEDIILKKDISKLASELQTKENNEQLNTIYNRYAVTHNKKECLNALEKHINTLF